MMHFEAIPYGSDPIIQFAADEFVRYMQMPKTDFLMTRGKCQFGRPRSQFQYCIGLISDLAPQAQIQVEDPTLDDGIYIDAWNGSAVIAGTNPRSTLIAVYRFLHELGFRWLRPGEDGVFVPECVWQVNMLVQVQETAAHRHRGVCIEGASSVENLVDMIDWLPKIGCNSYFLQFEDATVFLNRWYAHTNNPCLSAAPKSPEQTKDMTESIIREIKKRGLLLHAMGHGWTTKCLGLQDNGWEKANSSQQIDWMLAQVNGKRELFGGVPTNTNLCYSSAQVRDRFADIVVDYAARHPDVDYLHVWLADTYNNQCECEQCRTLTPSDWYIRILNQIDQMLEARHLPTRIVLLAYQELLWPPQTERLSNPDRFVLMFAPISRSFEKSCLQMGDLPSIPPYRRNQISLPEGLEENVAFLREWKKVFSGDSFDYDYHLGRAHYGDPGYSKISSVLSEDVRCLKKLGLNGLLLCQEQRICFPTALPNYMCGQLLWNTGLDPDQIAQDYYRHCFGSSWRACRRYLETVSSAFDMDFWNGKSCVDKAQALEKLDAFLKEFPSLAKQALATEPSEQKCQTCSHEILKAHREYVALFAKAIRCKLLGQDAEADAAWKDFTDYICRMEESLQPWLDVYRVIEIGENYTGFRR